MHLESTSEESHWTPEEQTFIARIMHSERVPRLEAIRRMQRRKRARLPLVRPKEKSGRTASVGRAPERIKAPTTLRAFADKHRVKIQNTGAELTVPGRFGEIANDYGDGFLRLRLLAVPRSSSKHDKALRSRGRKAAAAGMRLKVQSGAESIWLFQPENEGHVRLAVSLVAPRRKRTVNLTPEQKAALAERLARVRPARSKMVENAA